MADGQDSGETPAPPPASDKPKPEPKPSQFPRPTMDAIHGSLDPPRENMLNLSQRREPPKENG
jgi:hypothetical protein